MCVAASLALTAASGLWSAAASKAQADAQARAYENQAKTAESNARLAALAGEREMEHGAREERQMRRQARQFQGTQRAQLAASGAQMSGSPLSVLADTAGGIEEDAAAIRFSALQNKWERDMQSANFQNQAGAARASAEGARSAGRWGMFSSLLSTGVGIAGMAAGPSAGVRVRGGNVSIRPRLEDYETGFRRSAQRWGLI